MSLKLIHKPRDERTESDLKCAFEILFQADGTVSRYFRYDEVRERMNDLLDSLQMCSKSRMMSCDLCPFSVKCKYIVKAEQKLPEIARIGKNLHFAGETFWKRANRSLTEDPLCDELKNARDDNELYRIILKRFFDLVPERSKQILDLASSFAKFEFERISGIFGDLGKAKDVIDEFVKPVHCELAIENYSNDLMGIIDRIDRTSNGEYLLIEYKFGKPKYMDINWQERLITKEISFYKLLLDGNEVYEIERDTFNAKKISVRAPKYGAMIFFQDLQNSNMMFEIEREHIESAEKSVQSYWERLNTGNFKPKPLFSKNSDCMDWCGYYDEICEHNDEWKAVDAVGDIVWED